MKSGRERTLSRLKLITTRKACSLVKLFHPCFLVSSKNNPDIRLHRFSAILGYGLVVQAAFPLQSDFQMINRSRREYMECFIVIWFYSKGKERKMYV
jgi:hypothetical protein